MSSLSDLESLLARWESDEFLLQEATFSRRVAILDELDRYFSEPELLDTESTKDLIDRSRALSSKLNSLNNQFFTSIRRQIQTGICPTEFRRSLQGPASPPPRGLTFDWLDDLIAGVFQFEQPAEEPRALLPETVFYQPTPARHVFHLIAAASISRDDILIDLGSGLGHVPILTSICTGATSIGIEFDPAWVASAEKCAEALKQRNVSFLTQDARQADLSTGTVFYLYTPFTGATLASVLESLCQQASLRPIRICTFGPCTLAVGKQSWLQPLTPPKADQITVFLHRT